MLLDFKTALLEVIRLIFEEVTLDKVRNVPSYLPKMHLCVDVRYNIFSGRYIKSHEGLGLGFGQKPVSKTVRVRT